MVEPKVNFEQKTALRIMSLLPQKDSNGNLFNSVLNLQDIDIINPRNTEIAFFSFLGPQQAGTLAPIDPHLFSSLYRPTKFMKPEDFVPEINQLTVDENFSSDSQTPRPKPEHKKFRLPTPETCKNPETLQGVEKSIYTELLKL